AELLVHPYRSGNPALAAATFATLRSYDNLEWVDPSPAIAREAARLRAAYSLRTPDAVHVATALSVKADWIVTNDKGLRRVEAEGVNVWLFDEATE
ncbi:MAG TPA: PIN domain-containing protein, partial [Longimicrobiaceae bacterium]|nr:PIN domain-containing protein [Longimicrobiaceae bacterium]